jgi:N-acetylmuramic acid 6-phosphate etherase
MKPLTESDSKYNHLEKMKVKNILININHEDRSVPNSVRKAVPQIEKLVQHIIKRMKQGGRLFYLGAGTSGRLGILDASECPPTFGVPQNMIIGIIAGGDKAIRKAVEFAEDDTEQGWIDLQKHKINKKDTVIGIAASGTTPYVIGALQKCRLKGISTGCITCNPGSPLVKMTKYPIIAPVGPEFLTGSTRMKAGTAQKLILNMISTSVMIKLGRVRGNKMVDMLLSNKKLVERGTKMIMNQLKIDYKEANKLLLKYNSVRTAIDSFS